MEKVFTKNGLEIDAIFIKEYSRGKLFFAQERLLLTDFNNKELYSFDVISFIEQVL